MLEWLKLKREEEKKVEEKSEEEEEESEEEEKSEEKSEEEQESEEEREKGASWLLVGRPLVAGRRTYPNAPERSRRRIGRICVRLFTRYS